MDEEYQAIHTFEAVDNALLACPDHAAFEAAVDDHPDAVTESSAETLVVNRCQYSDDLDEASICSGVTGDDAG
jgi:hypothetical protein